PLDETLRMATLYPARAIGADNELGKIEAGKIANIASFDKDFNLCTTFVNGIEITDN
ncbi:N-acetylglucosamine-6-phosphate deacetylase, partial [Klebsiella oxytoca]